MQKKQTIDANESATIYKQDRYLLLPAAAERIGLPLRTLRAWREKCRFDPDTAGLFAKHGKFVFFDLDAWARHLERIQKEAIEAARAGEPLPPRPLLPCRSHCRGHSHGFAPRRQVLAGAFPSFLGGPYGAASFFLSSLFLAHNTRSIWEAMPFRASPGTAPRVRALQQ